MSVIALTADIEQRQIIQLDWNSAQICYIDWNSCLLYFALNLRLLFFRWQLVRAGKRILNMASIHRRMHTRVVQKYIGKSPFLNFSAAEFLKIRRHVFFVLKSVNIYPCSTFWSFPCVLHRENTSFRRIAVKSLIINIFRSDENISL